MGQDLYNEFGFVRELFDMGEEISKRPLSRYCFQGPMDKLTETINLQPAVTAVNLACLAAVASEGVEPAFTAGHSLGEFSALCASEIISKEDTFSLVFNRAKLMHRDALKHKGAMAAILGLSMDIVKQMVESVSENGIVSVANHNSELQIVITGAPEPVHQVSQLAKQSGGKAIGLKVSGAWHSELIRDAEKDFLPIIEQTHFNEPRCPVVHNVTAGFSPETPKEIKKTIGGQLCSPVKWFDSMKQLEQSRTDIYVEIGPGKVLAGLLKKILPKNNTRPIYTVHDLKTLETFLKQVS
jgi:[acyl-carrier-protein] S-malonyltransferase